jgi:outer membrane receptor protein involved in Fe transport
MARAFQPAGPGTAFPPGQAPVIPIWVQNNYDGRNRGLELTLHQDLRRGLRAIGNYSYLFDARQLRPGFNPAESLFAPTYSPRHSGQVRISWDTGRRWTLEGAIFHFTRMRSSFFDEVPATSRVDVHIARKIGESGEVYVSGQNLLYGRRREFISDWIYPAQDILRSIQIGFSWQF